MSQERFSITDLWTGLRNAGMPEVMLYLPDGTASRSHWDDTVCIGQQRVALLGDLERGIVRLIPVDSCVGIGVAAPKGTDPIGYRGVVRERLFSGSGVVDSAQVVEVEVELDRSTRG